MKRTTRPRQPNLFIAGAPKCGTSAMFTYLGSHPRVFFPALKEPGYFLEDFGDLRGFRDWDHYLSLFRHATGRHTVVGEATPYYFYSDAALDQILQRCPDSRFLFLVRNPVETTVALHNDHVYCLFETETNPLAAWRLQDRRARGDAIPRTCPCAKLLQYRRVAAYGAQLERVYQRCSPERVKVIVFDDFVSRTQEVYRDVLAFLELPDDGRQIFPPVNERRAWRWRWLQSATHLYRIPRPIRAAGRLLGLNHVYRHVRNWNTTPQTKQPIPDDFRRVLAAAFRDDVQLLSRLLDRDLSHWLAEPAGARRAVSV